MNDEDPKPAENTGNSDTAPPAKPSPRPDPRLKSTHKAIETGAPVSVVHEAEDVGSASESPAEATEPAGSEESVE